MPLNMGKKRSTLKKILSGGLQGAGNALLLQSLLGEEEVPLGEGDPFQADPLLGPTPSPGVSDIDAEFPAIGAPDAAPPLPQQGGIEGLEGMDLQAILDFLMSQGQQQR